MPATCHTLIYCKFCLLYSQCISVVRVLPALIAGITCYISMYYLQLGLWNWQSIEFIYTLSALGHTISAVNMITCISQSSSHGSFMVKSIFQPKIVKVHIVLIMPTFFFNFRENACLMVTKRFMGPKSSTAMWLESIQEPMFAKVPMDLATLLQTPLRLTSFVSLVILFSLEGQKWWVVGYNYSSVVSISCLWSQVWFLVASGNLGLGRFQWISLHCHRQHQDWRHS